MKNQITVADASLEAADRQQALFDAGEAKSPDIGAPADSRSMNTIVPASSWSAGGAADLVAVAAREVDGLDLDEPHRLGTVEIEEDIGVERSVE